MFNLYFLDLTEDSNVSIEEVVVSKMSYTFGYNPNCKDEEKAKKDNTVDSTTELKNKNDHSEKTANKEQEKQKKRGREWVAMARL